MPDELIYLAMLAVYAIILFGVIIVVDSIGRWRKRRARIRDGSQGLRSVHLAAGSMEAMPLLPAEVPQGQQKSEETGTTTGATGL